MSTTLVTTNISLHQLSVGVDYAFPIGAYAFEAAHVGDATGGSTIIEANYPPGYLYSLEGVSGLKQSTTGADMVVTWFPHVVRQGHGFIAFLDMGAGGIRQVGFGRDMGRRLPLSVPNPGALPVSCHVEFDLNNDGIVYRMSIWGYYWDFRATRTPSGPMRPI